MNSRDNEREFGGMLRRGLASGTAAPESECLDAALLAAYYERTLAADEIRACDLHVSQCARCRSQLAALARAEPERAATSPRIMSWLFDWRLLVPVTAALAIFVAWVAVRRPFDLRQRAAVTPIVAQNQPPAAAPLPTPPAMSEAVEVSPAPVPREKKAVPQAAPRAKRMDALEAGAGASGATQQNRLGNPQAPARARKERAEEPEAGNRRVRGTSVGGVAGGAAASTLPAAPAAATVPPSASEAVEVESSANAISTDAAPAPAPPPAPSPRAITTSNAPAAHNAAAAGAARGRGSAAGISAQKSAAPRVDTVTSRFEQDNSRIIVIPTPESSVLWRVARLHEIEFSHDGGATWQQQTTEAELILTAGSASSSKVCWIVGRRGTILRTVDGETWQRIKSPTPLDIVTVTTQDAGAASITAADGAVYITDDGGDTWTKK
jgi:Photosynthesis system II assembly factor YCF48